MISLKDNRTALMNLHATIQAIENLDALIENYSKASPGPAYVTFDGYSTGATRVQFDREIMVIALTAQRAQLTAYLATLGIMA
jgi:hypothetical protein